MLPFCLAALGDGVVAWCVCDMFCMACCVGPSLGYA